jgi:hypothetical protein
LAAAPEKMTAEVWVGRAYVNACLCCSRITTELRGTPHNVQKRTLLPVLLLIQAFGTHRVQRRSVPGVLTQASVTMIRGPIADDHEVVRSGLRRLIEGQTDWEVVAEAGDGKEAE